MNAALDAIQIDRTDGLVTITFNRPERKNALNADCWNQLDRALEEIAYNPEDRAVMLTGSGGNFSAGADLSPRDPKGVTLGLTGRPVQPIVQEKSVVGDMILRLHRLPKPTLAKVDGVAVGVGLGVALACDLVVASDRARFSEIFSKRGLALDGGNSWILPRIVGLQQAKYLAYFGDVIDAREARELGLVRTNSTPSQGSGGVGWLPGRRSRSASRSGSSTRADSPRSSRPSRRRRDASTSRTPRPTCKRALRRFANGASRIFADAE